MKENIFKEAWEVSGLSEREQAFYWMIQKYRDKVSQRLLNERARLRKKGKDIFEASMLEFMKQIDKSNWLKLIPKENGWQGAYIKIPLKY